MCSVRNCSRRDRGNGGTRITGWEREGWVANEERGVASVRESLHDYLAVVVNDPRCFSYGAPGWLLAVEPKTETRE